MLEGSLQTTRDLIQDLPAAVYTIDAHGRIESYNAAAAELWGRRPSRGEGSWYEWVRIFTADGTPIPRDGCPLAQAMRERRPISGVEIVIERPDSARRHVLAYAKPILDSSGALAGGINVLLDITDRKHAERAVRLLEDRLRIVTRAGMVGVWDWDVQADRVNWTDSLFAIHGVTQAEFDGTLAGFKSLVHPADRDFVAASISNTLRQGTPLEMEFRAVRSDGQIIWVFTHASAVLEHGRVVRLVGATIDVTERHRAQAAARQSEQSYAVLAESMPFGVWQCDADGGAVYANDYLQRYTGWPPERFLTDELWQIVHPDERAEAAGRFAQAIARTEPYHVTHRLRRFDGVWHWFEMRAEPVRGADGRIARWVGTALDVDDRRRAERAMVTAKDALARQVEGLTRLHDLVLRLNKLQDIKAALQAILETAVQVHGGQFGLLSRYDPERHVLEPQASVGLDKRFLDQVETIAADSTGGACGTAWSQRRHIIVEDTEADPCFENLRLAARQAGFRAVHSTPVINRQGEAVGVLTIQFAQPRRPEGREVQLMDLCSRHAADAIDAARDRAALQQSRQLFDVLAAHAPTAIFVKGLDGRYQFANPITCMAVGHPEGILGRSDAELMPPELVQTLRQNDQEVIETQRAIHREEFVGGRWYLSVKFPLPDEDGKPRGVCGMAVDIHDQKTAAESIRRSDALARSVAESSPDSIKILDLQGRLVWVNTPGLRLMEITDAESVRDRVWSELWTDGIARASAEAAMEQARAGGIGRFQGFRPTVRGTPKWWDVVVVPIPGPDGRPERLLTVSRDITEQQDADRRMLEFLSEISQELRRPLAPMGQAVDSIRTAQNLPVPVQRAGETLQGELNRLTRLVDRLAEQPVNSLKQTPPEHTPAQPASAQRDR